MAAGGNFYFTYDNGIWVAGTSGPEAEIGITCTKTTATIDSSYNVEWTIPTTDYSGYFSVSGKTLTITGFFQIPDNCIGTHTYPDGTTIELEQAPSVPTPDWANSFVKTSAGNKAVEKVWIKQNGQLVTVYDGGGGGAAVNFATDSWETISAACKDGSYKTVYKVGDTKDIELSTGETITVAIMGFDHDDLSDGSGKAPITLGMTELLATTYQMNATITNAGGWDECLMRASTMATLLSQLPSDLQGVIKQVNKKATAGSQGTAITTSADKLFLFALAELASKTGLENSTGTPLKNNAVTYEQEGTQYEYFKNTVGDADLWVACPALVKKLSNGSGSASTWWSRSPVLDSNNTFWCVKTLGDVDYLVASSSYGVSFGFCIG